ncbi:hypothetical protein B0H21DRAFT_502937 [Amylocystis lapponica]|nr:hypothetical protein B0H21DRAFT_502937 [Amylocystis lapponica]
MDPIRALNNHLQGTQQSAALAWVTIPPSAQNGQQWTMECKIHGIVMGRGSAPQKTAAMRIAAQQALQSLGGAV